MEEGAQSRTPSRSLQSRRGKERHTRCCHGNRELISLSRKLLNALGNSKRKITYVVEVEVGGGIWRRFMKDRRDWGFWRLGGPWHGSWHVVRAW